MIQLDFHSSINDGKTFIIRPMLKYKRNEQLSYS